jgi:hypothetical protein
MYFIARPLPSRPGVGPIVVAPMIKAWPAEHPRFHMHFTPTYSSWFNQVERFFAHVTADLVQRSDHRSLQSLERDIRDRVKAWNENPRPFTWTKTAEQILDSLARLPARTDGAGSLAPHFAHDVGWARSGKPC